MTTRHEARAAALQILYSCEIGGAPPAEAIDAYFREHAPEVLEAEQTFTRRLVTGTMEETTRLDELVARHSRHWRLERLATLDRLILRMAIWELQHESRTPAAVVIDEAVELARTYSTDGSAAFVNGVLDAVRKGSRE